MAAKDYVWDSQAAEQIEKQELDKHVAKNKKHYDGLSKEMWDSLKGVSPIPEYLKHGDLWDLLLPIITRDSITLDAFEKRDLPAPADRGGAKWFAWFTHYVTETYLDGLSKGAKP